MKPKRFPDSLRGALPEMVRLCGWQGLSAEVPEAEEADAEERELWRKLVARVDAPDRFYWLRRLARVGSWPSGAGALRFASLATGALAAGWVIIVIAPPGAPPVPAVPSARGPAPTVGSFRRPPEGLVEHSAPAPDRARILAAVRQDPASDHGKRTSRGHLARAEGRGAPQQQAGQGGLRKSGSNGSPPRSRRSLKSTAVPSQAVPSLLGPAIAQAPQQPVADAGLPPDEVRSPLDPYTSRPGAQRLCAALAAFAPVPPGLKGFALVEVALGIDGALVEGDSSARTLVSGGEQVDRYALRSLRALTAGGLVGSSGRYSVALEAQKRRWSCQAALESLGHVPLEPGASP